MPKVDKKEIGSRIKLLRKNAGLRQWQVAERLETTQSAVHKYENGVLPEASRLLELARIGNTTIEWILTGRHWENGSDEMSRVSPEVYELAHAFNQHTDEDRSTLSRALGLLHDVVQQLRWSLGKPVSEITPTELSDALQGLDSSTRRALTVAATIHRAVQQSLLQEHLREQEGSELYDRVAADAAAEPMPSNPSLIHSENLEKVLGHIQQLDRYLHPINAILQDPDLKAEFDQVLGEFQHRVQENRSAEGPVPMNERQAGSP